MKTPARLLTLAATLAFGSAVFAEETPAPAAPPAPAKKLGSLKYTPPKTGGGSRMDGDGGSRGGGEKMPSIYVLAPEHLALTTQAQPSLFWFQTLPAKAEFELTLTEPKKSKPLLNVGGGAADKAGIRSLSLARHGVTLAPGVAYNWSVAIIADPKNRSKDVIASGMIKRVEEPADLAKSVAAAAPEERAVLYAQSGFWYDALQSISTAIAANPKNANLHQLRASLLDQAKLPQAAAADRK